MVVRCWLTGNFVLFFFTKKKKEVLFFLTIVCSLLFFLKKRRRLLDELVDVVREAAGKIVDYLLMFI